jgi:3-methyladenine DNA glycosylase AlkD
MSPDDLRGALREVADPDRAGSMAPYLGAVPGGYGEGDVLLGVRVPETRRIARAAMRGGLGLDGALELLRSEVHEERLLALVVMVERHRRGDARERRAIYDAYLAHTAHVDNWDLVDTSAPEIVGGELLDGERGVLDGLAASSSVWERRIALLATFAFIRAGELDDTYRLAERLLDDRHDLIHKAAGWMLREAGKRDEPRLIAFLDRHAPAMPRTMLRYALEKVEPRERARLMGLR